MGCLGSKEEMSEATQTASPLQNADNAATNPVPADYRNKNRPSTTRLVTGGKEASVAAVMNRLNTRRGGRYTKGTMFGVSRDNNLVRDRKNAGDRVYSASGPHVVLMAASNVPSLQWSGRVSPFIVMWAEANAMVDGSEISDMWEWRGQKVIWPTRHSATPVWMSGRGFDVPAKYRDRAILRIEMWDELDSKARFIGAAAVRFDEVLMDMRSAVPLEPNMGLYARALNTRRPPCTVFFRLVGDPAPTRHVFFLRHGESKWNKAQKDLDLKGMWSTVDHPLNDAGRDQAGGLRDKISNYVTKHRGNHNSVELPTSLRSTIVSEDFGKGHGAEAGGSEPASGSAALADTGTAQQKRKTATKISPEAERDLIEMFLNTKTIWASPLTRATCTALVALEPILCPTDPASAPRLVLTPNAREKRTFGGKDSSGCAFGDEKIKKHMQVAMAKLFRSILPRENGRLEKLNSVDLDTLQCGDKWWSSVKESTAILDNRIDELFAQIRYSEGDRPIIVVGHSFYIRQVIRKLVGDGLKEKSTVAERLSKYKVGNAGLVHFELDFANSDGIIKDLHLMFGSHIELPKKKNKKKKKAADGAAADEEDDDDDDDDDDSDDDDDDEDEDGDQ